MFGSGKYCVQDESGGVQVSRVEQKPVRSFEEKLGEPQDAVEVLKGVRRFRDRDPVEKARRLPPVTSVSLQLGQARKEWGRDTLALAEALGMCQCMDG